MNFEISIIKNEISKIKKSDIQRKKFKNSNKGILKFNIQRIETQNEISKKSKSIISRFKKRKI